MKKQLLPSTHKGNETPGREGVPPSNSEECTPNSATRKAMDELEQGKGKRFDGAEELFEDLGV